MPVVVLKLRVDVELIVLRASHGSGQIYGVWHLVPLIMGSLFGRQGRANWKEYEK